MRTRAHCTHMAKPWRGRGGGRTGGAEHDQSLVRERGWPGCARMRGHLAFQGRAWPCRASATRRCKRKGDGGFRVRERDGDGSLQKRHTRGVLGLLRLIGGEVEDGRWPTVRLGEEGGGVVSIRGRGVSMRCRAEQLRRCRRTGAGSMKLRRAAASFSSFPFLLPPSSASPLLCSGLDWRRRKGKRIPRARVYG